jgi:HEPN domain-containing protein
MKPREEAKRRLVTEWLHKADDDLGVAERLLSEDAAYPDAIAFHSQQAAEKCLKAFLAWRETDFPKTHDLAQLLDLIHPLDATLAESLRDVIVLTPYGVELRYPGDRPEATPREAQEAVELARKVRQAVNAALRLA